MPTHNHALIYQISGMILFTLYNNIYIFFFSDLCVHMLLVDKETSIHCTYHCKFFHQKPIGNHLHTSTQSFQWYCYTAGCIQRYLQHTRLHLHFTWVNMYDQWLQWNLDSMHCAYQCMMSVCRPSGIPLDRYNGRNQPHSHTELSQCSCVHLLCTHQYLY